MIVGVHSWGFLCCHVLSWKLQRDYPLSEKKQLVAFTVPVASGYKNRLSAKMAITDEEVFIWI